MFSTNGILARLKKNLYPIGYSTFWKGLLNPSLYVIIIDSFCYVFPSPVLASVNDGHQMWVSVHNVDLNKLLTH